MIDKPELEIPTGLKALGMTSFSVLRIIQTTIYPSNKKGCGVISAAANVS